MSLESHKRESHRGLRSALDDLHRRAGKPTSRAIADAVGTSHTTVADALAGRRVPSWSILEKIVVQLGGDVERFRALWADAAAPPSPSAGQSDVERFAAQYRRQVAAPHIRLRNPSDSRPFAPLFDDAYLPQRLRRLDVASESYAVLLSATDLARSARRTLVLGAPGSGKSTLCQALVRQVALDPDGPVPFLLQLRDFAGESPPRRSIVEYIEHQAKTVFQVTAPSGVVAELLERGQAIVLFDGLDELANSAHRADIAAIIESFARGFPLSAVVVTSREIAAYQTLFAPQAFEEYLLEELTEPEVEEYCRRWFRANEGPSVGEPDELANEFLRQSSFLPDLRRNPLLLALLCSLYVGTRYIPTNLVEICDMSAELLYRRWDAMRGITVGQRLNSASLALASLAYYILEHQASGLALPRRQVIQLMTDYFASRSGDLDKAAEEARDFVDFCTGRAMVFSDVGAEGIDIIYGFTHYTFLEYFAALQLVRMSDSPEQLAEILTARVALGEWLMLGQFAVQIMDRNTDNGAYRVVSAMLARVHSQSPMSQRRVREFVVNCTEFVTLPSKFVRELELPPPPLTEEIPDGTARLCMAADVVGTTRLPADLAAEIMHRFEGALGKARRNAGMDDTEMIFQAAGDGHFAIFPSGIDESWVIARFLEGLQDYLAQINGDALPETKLRVRVAMQRGLVGMGATGIMGSAVITVHRMLDSAPLRIALEEHPAADFVLGVGDTLFHDVVQGSDEMRTMNALGPATAVIHGKGFSQTIWLYVPATIADQADGITSSSFPDTRGVFRECAAIAAQGGSSLLPLADQFRRASERLGEPMRLAVVGQIKRGKSTLVNALIGQQVAAPGQLELPFAVSELRYGDQPAVFVRYKDGSSEGPMPLMVLESLTRADPAKADRSRKIQKLEFALPNEFLRSFQLADTPGLSSIGQIDAEKTRSFLGVSAVFDKDAERLAMRETLSAMGRTAHDVHEESVSEIAKADAVLYLFSHGLREDDYDTVGELLDSAHDTATPLRAIAVLTRCDQFWPPDRDLPGSPDLVTYDPMVAAGKIAERYMDRADIRRLFYTVAPVAGLLGTAAYSLTNEEFGWLDDLGKIEPGILVRRLRDVSRFVAAEQLPDVRLPVAMRKRLIGRLGAWGIHLTCGYLRNGFGEDEIRDRLVADSGVARLRELIAGHFGNRASIIKLDHEIREVTAEIGRCRIKAQLIDGQVPEGLEIIAAKVERLRVGEHLSAEISALSALYNGELSLRDDEVREILTVTGEYGTTCAARLGLPEDTPVWNLAAAAERLAAEWARRECDPTLNAATLRAARTVRRSYDQIAHQISQAQDLLTMTGRSVAGGLPPSAGYKHED
jgi:GTPase SAR1 family protein